MKSAFAIALLVCARAVHAADAEVRIEVNAYAASDIQLAAHVQREIKLALETINGVVTVAKQPDVLVSVSVKPFALGTSDMVMIAYVANDLVPDNIAVVSLRGEATKAGIHNAQVLLGTLVANGMPLGVVGPREDIPRLCAEIASSIDRTTVVNYRKYPTDRDPDKAFDDFMGRIGALPVIAPAGK